MPLLSMLPLSLTTLSAMLPPTLLRSPLPQATLVDVLSRIPALSWLSAGQLDGMNDSVLTQWMNTGKTSTLRALDLDSSDNITEDMLGKFLDRVG